MSKIEKLKDSFFNLSVDRLTIMCEEVTFKNGKKIDVGEKINGIRSFPFIEFMGTEKSISRFSVFNGKVFMEYADPFIYKNRKCWRFDFNPNKLNKREMDLLIHNLFPNFKLAHLSRIDIAFDFETDLSNIEFTQKNPTKFAKFFGLDTLLETLYIGSRGSSKMLRIYNKKKEREDDIYNEDIEPIDKENWWRIEYELRREDMADEFLNVDFFKYFRLFRGYEFFDNKELEWKDAFILTALKNGRTLAEIPNKNTRTKYKKMLRESSNVKEDLTEQLRELYESNLENMLKPITSLMLSFYGRNDIEIWQHDRLKELKVI